MKFLGVIRNAWPLLNTLIRVYQKKPFAFSFNLTDRCPNNCNCYWRAQSRTGEMPDDEVISFFKQMKTSGYRHATIIGGEPYVRPKLLPAVTSIMDANWIVTSGVLPLMNLPRTTHFISIDGQDAKTHDRVRRNHGLFRRVFKNIQQFRKASNAPVYLHSVLNQINYQQIRGILSFWIRGKMVNGVIMSTITPIYGIRSELWLTTNQKKWIVAELLEAKKEFGDFLCMTNSMIAHLHPDNTAKLTPEKCGTAIYSPSFDAKGNKMAQCVLSDKAKCSECGCVITAMMNAFFPRLELKELAFLLKITTV